MTENLETLTEEQVLARIKGSAMPKVFVKEIPAQLDNYLIAACYVKPQEQNGKQYPNKDDSREHY